MHHPDKSFQPDEDTIAAISTPFGESGIGIVRLSGSSAERIAKKLFRPKRASASLISHQIHFGEILDPGNESPVDEVLLVLMKSPKTYTCEDVVEIQCHGGYLILQKILQLVLEEGARMALPGEFTKRAFLNGRIDLTQAEAVIDLIRARTTAGLGIANQQLKGELYREIASLKSRLVDHLAFVEAHIDFPEDEIEPISLDEMERDLEMIVQKLEEWSNSYEEGRIFREGISCAIAGNTNVGKSSLLNKLLKDERAIVTPFPGTTRDVIEEVLNIGGIPVRLMDTAGLRKTVDFVEEEGVKRARERVAESDLVLLVVDGSREIEGIDREIFEEVRGKQKVVVMNKNDLPSGVSLEKMEELLPDDPKVSISALSGEGIENLKQTIFGTLVKGGVRVSPEHRIIANIRHKIAIDLAKETLLNAIRGLSERTSPEFIAFEIRSSLESLREIVGETTTEEVLNRIFEKFCIGK